MPELVDPYIGFVSFKEAVANKAISMQKSDSNPDLHFLYDYPAPGVSRLTYAVLPEGKADAYVVFAQNEPIDGVKCFGLGYATDSACRNKGLMSSLLPACLKDFKNKIAASKMAQVYVEAVVSIDNTASNILAEKHLGKPVKETSEALSGEQVFVYQHLLTI